MRVFWRLGWLLAAVDPRPRRHRAAGEARPVREYRLTVRHPARATPPEEYEPLAVAFAHTFLALLDDAELVTEGDATVSLYEREAVMRCTVLADGDLTVMGALDRLIDAACPGTGFSIEPAGPAPAETRGDR